MAGDDPLGSLQRRVHELELLQRAAIQLGAASTPEEAMVTAVSLLADAVRAPRARLYTWVDRRPVLRAMSVEGSPELVSDEPPRAPSALPASARRAMRSLIDAESGDLFVPLTAEDEQLAVVVLDRSSTHGFAAEDGEAADELAALVGPALRNAMRTSGLEERMEQLLEMERVKSEFLNLASHELRGPLTVLMGYMSLLEDGAFGEVPEAFMATMPVINARLTEMEVLMNAMLETARLDDGRLRLDLVTVDLREIVDDALRRCELFVHPGQRLGLRCPDRPVPVNVDRERVLTVVSNLVHNAIKYSLQHTDVVCAIVTKGETAEVAVRDSGIGIAPEDLETLFTRFGRIRSNPDVRSVPGTGLGLYLSRELARAHGGDILVESSPGEGSVFTVVLPLAS
jgi:signal transduction histidine kinase